MKLLLTSGKSGTIVSASATGSAGQLKNDGSTTLTRLSRPVRSPARPGGRWSLASPRPAKPAPGRALRAGQSRWCPEPRYQVDDDGRRYVGLPDPDLEPASTSPLVLDDDRERCAEVEERVVAAGVDVDAAGPRDVPQRAELAGLCPGEDRGAGEPVAHGRVGNGQVGDLGHLPGDGRHGAGVGKRDQSGSADRDAAAQQPVAGRLLVEPQQGLAEPWAWALTSP